ncbi:MAG: helix-turn-helix transcriptional regulator [Opitutales bacterium]|nr:helix-turn-helix transcriptional regulator [Opitutales bacterium]
MSYNRQVPAFARCLTVRHSHCVWWHILCGSVSVDTVGGTLSGGLRARPGTSLCMAPGEVRTHVFTPDARVISVHFSVETPDGRSLFRGRDPVVWQPGGAADDVAAAGGRLANAVKVGRGGVPADGLRIRGQLYLFAAALFNALEATGTVAVAETAADSRLQAVQADLSRAPRAGPLPYERWTRLTGLSRSQLDRLCRRHCAESLRTRRDAVLMARLERALAADSRDIKALAYDHGFVDASHLTRWFRRQSGTTPGAFRQSLRGIRSGGQ